LFDALRTKLYVTFKDPVRTAQ